MLLTENEAPKRGVCKTINNSFPELLSNPVQSNLQIRRNGYEKWEGVVPNRFENPFLMSFHRLGRVAMIVSDIKNVDNGIC